MKHHVPAFRDHPLGVAVVTVLSRGSGFVRNIVLVRMLANAPLLDGFFAAQAPFQFFSSVTGGAVAIAFINHLAGHRAGPRLYGAVARRLALVTLAVSALALGPAEWFAHAVPGRQGWGLLYAVGLGGVVFSSLRSLASAAAQLHSNFLVDAFSNLVLNVVQIVLLASLLVLRPALANSAAGVGGTWGIAIVAAAAYALAARAHTVANQPIRHERADRPDPVVGLLLRDGGWLGLSQLAPLAWVMIDRSLATGLTAGMVAVVAILSTLYHILASSIGGSAAAVLHPRFAAVARRAGAEEARTLHQAVAQVVAWTLLAGSGLAAGAHLILRLATPRGMALPAEGATLIALYAAAATAGGSQQILSRALMAFRSVRSAAFLSAGIALGNLGVSIVLFRTIGVIGLPIGLAVSQLTYVGAAYALAFRPRPGVATAAPTPYLHNVALGLFVFVAAVILEHTMGSAAALLATGLVAGVGYWAVGGAARHALLHWREA